MKAGQASSTAKVIAASTIALASDPATAAQVAPGAADLCLQFLRGSRADRWLARSAQLAFTRRLWRAVEGLTLPGIMAHYWRRKRWIESRCRSALDSGFQRVVVLGAGLDTLGLRLAREFPALQVVEIDHPATQSAKRQALAAGSAAAPRCLQFVAQDLSAGPLAVAWPGPALDTVYILEGVLMYLAPDRVRSLLQTLCQDPAPRVRLIFSFMTRWPDGRSGFRPRSALIERWLAWRGEPFMWAIDPAALPGLLSQCGLSLVELASTRQWAPGSTALEGENLAVCERQG